MKNAIRLIMAGMLCMVLVAQGQEKAEEAEKCGGWLKKCDTNKNGKITCAEARACGLTTPIMKDHPARVSTDRQEAGNQRRQLRAFVDGHEGWKLVEEYRDEESGATGSRARFQALFEDAHQRKFEVVVFWALDRFSREDARATINYLPRARELRRWLCILHRALP